MSFVNVMPDVVTTASEELAGIRSTLSAAIASAAGPTTGVVAAAEDEISGAIATVFGEFGQQYQAIGAQAQAFHEQFVTVLRGGAAAYLGAEVAAGRTLQQALNGGLGGALVTSAVTGPYQNLIADTVTNMAGIEGTFVTTTAPALLKALGTQISNPLEFVEAIATGNPQSVLGISARIAQGYTTLIQQLTVPVSISVTSVNPPNMAVALGVGLPELLAFDALGAPVNAYTAATASGMAIVNALQAGNPLAAATAAFSAPADIANAFLNGSETLSLALPIPGLSVTANVPFSGLLVPLHPFTATGTIPANPLIQTVTVTGPPVGGFVPALLEYVPQLLASALAT